MWWWGVCVSLATADSTVVDTMLRVLWHRSVGALIEALNLSHQDTNQRMGANVWWGKRHERCKYEQGETVEVLVSFTLLLQTKVS